jgi:hypothetical protein
MKLDPLGDGKSALCLLDSMGNSLSVVNDARQSFAAESTEWTDRDGSFFAILPSIITLLLLGELYLSGQ